MKTDLNSRIWEIYESFLQGLQDLVGLKKNRPIKKFMDIETFRNYCLAKKGVTEEFPFGPDTLVFKVMGKMFALTGLEHVPYKISLKCDPERAIELREEYETLITSAYHFNKKHWNSISPEVLPSSLVRDLIDHSYDLVAAKLPKKLRESLAT